MYQLIYASQAVVDFPDARLVELLTTARTRNARAHITGVLLYSGKTFVQFLEGSQADIEALMARIEADPRHDRLIHLYRQETRLGRVFPDWSMGFSHMRFMDAMRIEGLETQGLAGLRRVLALNAGSFPAQILASIVNSNRFLAS